MTSRKKEPLSVVIITRNEEKNIARCLKSVLWADEIVVVDSGSTDKTVEICREMGCTVIATPWLGFGRTKQLAVNSASNNWVLSIDADEEADSRLKDSIRNLLQGMPAKKGYRIKRATFYVNRWIHHSGWNKDYPLRLFDRRYGNFNDKEVHESVVLKETPGTIDVPLLHYSYPDFATFLVKMEKYGQLGAQQKLDAGSKASIFSAIGHAMLTFVKMYILKAGYLDGTTGLALAINSAFAVYMKYLMLWEKKLPKAGE